jgi:Protein of unknown function (DUF3667)
MSGEIEAAGALATAGLAAKAIEGRGGRGVGEGACRNCETPLDGAYCHQCGQPAHISRTLGEVAHDFLHSVLHFDTRAWRTLPMLAVRPGTLTNQYIHGKRARFISPLALFLFTVFLMFFVFSVAGGGGLVRTNTTDRTTGEITVESARADLAVARQARDKAARDLATAETEAARVLAEGGPGAKGAATGILAGAKAAARLTKLAVIRAEERLRSAEGAAAATTGATALEITPETPTPGPIAADSAAKEAPATTAAAVVPSPAAAESPAKEEDWRYGISADETFSVDTNGEKSWQDQLREGVENGKVKVNFGNEKVNEKVRHSLQNPDLALYKLQQTAYKFSFLLVPISLPFIALLFLWRRGVTLFDHVVFSLYSLSFMSALFIAVTLLSRAGDWVETVIGFMLTLIPPAHMYFHLKGTYALGWWSALWRTMFLLLFVVLAAALFAVSILVLGLAA